MREPLKESIVSTDTRCHLEQHRVFTDEELSHGIPVEESRRRLTKLINNHYQQKHNDFFTAEEGHLL